MTFDAQLPIAAYLSSIISLLRCVIVEGLPKTRPEYRLISTNVTVTRSTQLIRAPADEKIPIHRVMIDGTEIKRCDWRAVPSDIGDLSLTFLTGIFFYAHQAGTCPIVFTTHPPTWRENAMYAPSSFSWLSLLLSTMTARETTSAACLMFSMTRG